MPTDPDDKLAQPEDAIEDLEVPEDDASKVAGGWSKIESKG